MVVAIFSSQLSIPLLGCTALLESSEEMGGRKRKEITSHHHPLFPNAPTICRKGKENKKKKGGGEKSLFFETWSQSSRSNSNRFAKKRKGKKGGGEKGEPLRWSQYVLPRTVAQGSGINGEKKGKKKEKKGGKRNLLLDLFSFS